MDAEIRAWYEKKARLAASAKGGPSDATIVGILWGILDSNILSDCEKLERSHLLLSEFINATKAIGGDENAFHS